MPNSGHGTLSPLSSKSSSYSDLASHPTNAFMEEPSHQDPTQDHALQVGTKSLVPPFTVCTEQHQLCAEQVGTLYTLLPEGSRHRFVHSASFHLCILSIYAIFWYLRGNSP